MDNQILSYVVNIGGLVSSRHRKYLRKLTEQNDDMVIADESTESVPEADTATEPVLVTPSPRRLRPRRQPVPHMQQ